MKTTFWGVRGSIPAPGPETNRYGGNTACVSVETAGGRLVVLDNGTGATVLGKHLMGREFGRGGGRAAIILTHAHWDHIQGFPFFAPVFVPGNRFDIFGHSRTPDRLEAVLEGQMSPQFSPVQSLKNLGADIHFHAVDAERPLEISGLKVSGLEVPHGATTALSVRLEDEDRVMVYASDVGYPEGEIPSEILDHYAGANVLIHDCTYSPEDQGERRNRGFSSIEDAARAAAEAEVEHLVMFHYDQDYSDTRVDDLTRRLRALLDDLGGKEIRLTAAAEGLTIDV